MREYRPLQGELEHYYRSYDNDSLYVYLRRGLRGIAILLVLCFLLWPLGVYRSRAWPTANIERFTQSSSDGYTLNFDGYKVNGATYPFHSYYFGGSPPAIFGFHQPKGYGQRLYYNPKYPFEHVMHRTPSWMTLILPLGALLSLWAAKRLSKFITPGAEKTAHPFKD